MTHASVIIPAHNEEAVLGRCLDRLAEGLPPDTEIIVVCNGCDDATAAVARRHSCRPIVIEHPFPSKIEALNLGDDAARGAIRHYVDADIEVAGSVIDHVNVMLAEGSGVLCAAPRPVFVLARRPWAIRAFYRVWGQIPYLTGNMVGSGFYALSATGRNRFGRFPRVSGDDKFILELFSDDERRTLLDDTFSVHTPTTLRGLLKMRTRVYRGNLQLDRAAATAGTAPTNKPQTADRTLIHLARSPDWLPAVLAYVAVNLLARLMARRRWDGRWERDASARDRARTSGR